MPNFAENPLPDKLYRFRSCDTKYFLEELRKAVEDQQAFFLALSNQNDPFECNPRIENSSIPEMKRALKEMGVKHLISLETIRNHNPTLSERELKRMQKREFPLNYSGLKANKAIVEKLPKMLRDDTKIICLTEHWENNLMWSHYANGLNGVAIEYSVQWQYIHELGYDLPTKMFYTNERPHISTIDILAWFEAGVNSKLPSRYIDDGNRAADAFINLKSSDWAYENEWRIMIRDQQISGYRFVPALKVQNVILGARIREEMKAKIRKICGSKVTVLLTELDSLRYGLRLIR